MIFQRQRFVLIALLVAGAFFMENLDGTVIATALPQMAPALACDSHRSQRGHERLHVDAGRLHSDQRMGRRPLWLAHDICRGDRHFHVLFDSLRAEQSALAIHRGAGSARHGRSHDGARRPPGRAPQYREERPHAVDRLHRLAGAGGADPRASRGRIHYHLRFLAMDLFSECSAGRSRYPAYLCAGSKPPHGRKKSTGLAGFPVERTLLLLLDVRFGFHGAAADCVVEGRRSLGAQHRMCGPGRLACPPPSVSADRFIGASHTDLCDRHLRRLAVSRCHWHGAVSAAHDVSGGLRHERVYLRSC